MSDNGRHPADPGDTDWGQKVDKQHQANTARLDGIDDRLKTIDGHITSVVGEQERMAVAIGRLDERMKASESDRKLMREELGVNTKVTKEIKDAADLISTRTEWILAFASNYKGIKKFLVWATPIVSVILTAYITWTVKK